MNMRILITAAALIIGCETSASAAVPLSSIYANPAAFRGKVVTTCGRNPLNGPTIMVEGLNFGRSPTVIWLDRAIKSASRCIEAEVVRANTPRPDPKLMDGPIALQGWRLKVLRVVPLK
jgi:hypothetical protein